MNKTRNVVTAVAVGMVGFVPASRAAPVTTGWVKFDLRVDQGNTYC